MSDPKDVRQDVLDGIDATAAHYDAAFIDMQDALRLLRVDTERHMPTEFDPSACGCCYTGRQPDDPKAWCGWCSMPWPCPVVLERAAVYAREEGRDG